MFGFPSDPVLLASTIAVDRMLFLANGTCQDKICLLYHMLVFMFSSNLCCLKKDEYEHANGRLSTLKWHSHVESRYYKDTTLKGHHQGVAMQLSRCPEWLLLFIVITYLHNIVTVSIQCGLNIISSQVNIFTYCTCNAHQHFKWHLTENTWQMHCIWANNAKHTVCLPDSNADIK